MFEYTLHVFNLLTIILTLKLPNKYGSKYSTNI